MDAFEKAYKFSLIVLFACVVFLGFIYLQVHKTEAQADIEAKKNTRFELHIRDGDFIVFDRQNGSIMASAFNPRELQNFYKWQIVYPTEQVKQTAEGK